MKPGKKGRNWYYFHSSPLGRQNASTLTTTPPGSCRSRGSESNETLVRRLFPQKHGKGPNPDEVFIWMQG
jgi:hypothetical protein